MLVVLRAPDGPPPHPPGKRESTEIFRASPRYLAQKLAVHIGSALALVGLETFAWLLSPDSTWLSRRISVAVIVATTLAAALRYLVLRLEYDLRYYMLSDQCLRIRRGSMIIEESTYTLANIQTVSLRQGPLDRLFGIGNLHVETAGGGARDSSTETSSGAFHCGKLEGIKASQARDLRDRILESLTHFKDSGLGEQQVETRTTQASPTTQHNSALSPRSMLVLRSIARELTEVNQQDPPL